MSKQTNIGSELAGIGLLVFIAVGLWASSEVKSLIASDQLRIVPEKVASVAQSTSTGTGKPIQIVEIVDQPVYKGGPVAYVDYSVDSFGECVVVWYPDGRFSHCTEVPEGWQTAFQKAVPAGTSYSDISSPEGWNTIYAPNNWR